MGKNGGAENHVKKFLLPTWALVKVCCLFFALFGHYFLTFLYFSFYGWQENKSYMSVTHYTRNLYVDIE
jgi:hypothetical protein